MTVSNADLIFEKWKASLRSKDRSAKAVSGNFDELFEELKRDGLDFDAAHDILPKAVKAHQPAPSLIKQTHKSLSRNPGYCKTEGELAQEWNDSIEDKAKNSFFDFFPLKSKDDEDAAPKVYGNMSEKEYKAQRKYANSFPVLDTAALEERMKAIQQYNATSINDTLNVLDEIDG